MRTFADLAKKLKIDVTDLMLRAMGMPRRPRPGLKASQRNWASTSRSSIGSLKKLGRTLAETLQRGKDGKPADACPRKVLGVSGSRSIPFASGHATRLCARCAHMGAD